MSSILTRHLFLSARARLGKRTGLLPTVPGGTGMWPVLADVVSNHCFQKLASGENSLNRYGRGCDLGIFRLRRCSLRSLRLRSR
jgi:hypothetical protein